MDPRERRTRERLRRALIDMLHEQEYSEIKVQDLTEKADCGVTTFYRQYKNKADLLEDVILRFPDMVDFSFYSKPHPISYLLEAVNSALLLPIIQIAHSERIFLRRLLHSPLHVLVLETFYRMALERIRLNTPAWTEKELHMVTGSVIGNVHQWILLELPYTPEEIAEMIHMSSIYGVLIQRPELDDVKETIHTKFIGE